LARLAELVGKKPDDQKKARSLSWTAEIREREYIRAIFSLSEGSGVLP
jgi:hypothetical protein